MTRISWKELIKYNKECNTTVAWKKQRDFIKSTLEEFIRRLAHAEKDDFTIPSAVVLCEFANMIKELDKK